VRQPIRILIIEDNDSIRALYKRLCRQYATNLDIEFAEAADMTEARRLIEAGLTHTEIVILDGRIKGAENTLALVPLLRQHGFAGTILTASNDTGLNQEMARIDRAGRTIPCGKNGINIALLDQLQSLAAPKPFSGA
jgi:DNA-binding NtrC family response regulator